MRKMRVVTVLSAIALATVLVPAARADLVGPYTVTVWNGTYSGGVTDLATDTHPAAAITAKFTYNGPINWQNNNPNGGDNTFAEFFGANAPNPASFTIGSWAALQNLEMSSPDPSQAGPGETGGATNTYIEITGTTTGSTPLFIQSDDGSCFYVGGVAVPGLCHPNPQSENNPAYNGVAPAGSFELDYVETNGAPSDLIVKTPEPSMLFLLGTGLFGLAFFAYRRQTHGTTPTLSL